MQLVGWRLGLILKVLYSVHGVCQHMLPCRGASSGGDTRPGERRRVPPRVSAPNVFCVSLESGRSAVAGAGHRTSITTAFSFLRIRRDSKKRLCKKTNWARLDRYSLCHVSAPVERISALSSIVKCSLNRSLKKFALIASPHLCIKTQVSPRRLGLAMCAWW
ncbi:hypothetical protein FN846DRAFT_2586 [Sphaerosporella brunnea]|uniref:Secreted protein n=1 Tax=Sphaerosporella brunnea TaxID=1250544 RepID=A0A5J5FCX6_9PEZI|nr:hypothetical protein FN846DRAFT_2586 [Sphaerosporella brunnea]